MAPLELSTSREDSRAVVTLRGELDLAAAELMDGEMGRVLGDGLALLVLDLRELSFMDSTGLRSILRADARAREAGARLVLVRGADVVHRVFEMTGMHARLEFTADPDAARADPV